MDKSDRHRCYKCGKRRYSKFMVVVNDYSYRINYVYSTYDTKTYRCVNCPTTAVIGHCPTTRQLDD